ncbi:MAG TPA: PQQ-binding-like beta-propeller repeat protein [Ktedonobacteraceae bacterium]|nr:PQQ-binding-like beta-propeller repeat protein [Ktedonobacteraceae bacterium]
MANGVVYAVVGYYPTTVQALDATTGAMKWSINVANYAGSSSAPAVANGVVYVGFDNGLILALDATNGTTLWHYTAGSYVRSSPTIVNGALYIGSDGGNLYAFHLSGTTSKSKTKRTTKKR